MTFVDTKARASRACVIRARWRISYWRMIALCWSRIRHCSVFCLRASSPAETVTPPSQHLQIKSFQHYSQNWAIYAKLCNKSCRQTMSITIMEDPLDHCSIINFDVIRESKLLLLLSLVEYLGVPEQWAIPSAFGGMAFWFCIRSDSDWVLRRFHRRTAQAAASVTITFVDTEARAGVIRARWCIRYRRMFALCWSRIGHYSVFSLSAPLRRQWHLRDSICKPSRSNIIHKIEKYMQLSMWLRFWRRALDCPRRSARQPVCLDWPGNNAILYK